MAEAVSSTVGVSRDNWSTISHNNYRFLYAMCGDIRFDDRRHFPAYFIVNLMRQTERYRLMNVALRSGKSRL